MKRVLLLLVGIFSLVGLASCEQNNCKKKKPLTEKKETGHRERKW